MYRTLQEKLLLSNPREFETIDENLKNINVSLFDAEIIDTQDKTPQEVALYIKSKIQEINKGDDLYERK